MNELKTLKDLTEQLAKVHGSAISYFEDALIKEAIKWIKHLEENDSYFEAFENIREGNDNVQKWIIDFFNITEEDLKNA